MRLGGGEARPFGGRWQFTGVERFFFFFFCDSKGLPTGSERNERNFETSGLQGGILFDILLVFNWRMPVFVTAPGVYHGAFNHRGL